MSYSVSVLKELVGAGASVKIVSHIHASSLKELVEIALQSGATIEVGYPLHASTAKELALMAPSTVTFVS